MLAGVAIGLVLGDQHSIILKEDGSVLGTGYNEYGQLGDGTTVNSVKFVWAFLSEVKTIAVAAGNDHSLAVKQDGSVWATGCNENGQLGDGSTTSSETYLKVISHGVKVVAAGVFHSMVQKHTGSIWAVGLNKYGQFGEGEAMLEQTFVRLAPFRQGLLRDHVHLKASS